MKRVIVLIEMIAMIGFTTGQPAWTQVNTERFGDRGITDVGSMAVYSGNLCVSSARKKKIPQISQPVDTNKAMRSLASHRISQAYHEDDPLYYKCCVNRPDEVTEYLEMAEKFFVGGNYIAANYWALRAPELLGYCERYPSYLFSFF